MSARAEGRFPMPGTAGEWTSIGDGLLTPLRFTVPMEDEPGCPYDIDLTIEIDNRRPMCRELTVRAREGGEAVTTVGLRTIRLRELVAVATASRTLSISETDDGGWVISPPDHHEFMGAYAVASDAPDRDLAAIARVYTEAVESGQPTEAVRAAFNVSKSTAQRRVREARAAGFDMPPPPRRPRKDTD